VFVSVLQFALAGLPITAILILMSQSIVVVHRGSGVPNFSAGAVGMIGAYIFFSLWNARGWAWPLAMVVAILAGGAIGAAIHLLLMRRLQNAPLTTKIIATLGVMTLLIAIANETFAKGGQILAEPSLLPNNQLHPLKGLDFSSQAITLTAVALAITVGLILLQRMTKFGLATTAVCENPGITAGMGHSPDVIAALNWAMGSAIAVVSTILLVPLTGLAVTTLTLAVVPALGAALIGQFDSFTLTLVGALVIGIGEAETALVTTAPGWPDAAPLIVIVLVLLVRGTKRHDRSEVARHLPSVGTGRFGPPAIAAIVIGIVLIVAVSDSWIGAVTTTILVGIVIESVVLLTGYGGQLSLAQYSLAGVSAFFTALCAIWGLPLWLSIIVAVVWTVPAGFLVAVPSLRTSGASFAIATLTLVIVIEDLVLTNSDVGGNLDSAFGPLTLFGVNFDPVEHPRFYAGLSFAVFVLVALLIRNIRRSASGRRLLAVRANPQAAAAVGVSVTGMKLYAFAIATAIAALGGALIEAQLSFPDFSLFDTLSSINLTLQATIGGVGWIPGSIIGSAAAPGAFTAQVLQTFISPSGWLDLITGAGVILVVLQSPDGVARLSASQLQAQARWIRRHILRRPDKPAREDVFARAVRTGSIRQAQSRRSRLEATGLSVTFGTQRALDDVSVSVEPGEIVGLIGPNGAGKSTFIDAICGNCATVGGTASLDGRPLDGLSSTQRAQRGLSRTFQSLELFEDMTVGENLLVASERPSTRQALLDLLWPKGARPTETARLATEDFRLTDCLGDKPTKLDYGRRRLVAVARAFACDPAVIFLDEPAAGLDGHERAELGKLIKRVARDWNVGVLLVEHDVNLVFSVCDKVVALSSGRVIATGTPEQVRHDPGVIEAYLGTSSEAEEADLTHGELPVGLDVDADIDESATPSLEA
jgi:ABC-type branched-subunit amino acid transport system ATPase component/branched-subunit amino acid ABC-type transport system permease component